MLSTRDERQESVWPALLRIVEAGQQVIADRLELGVLEIREELERTATRVATFQVGMITGGICWLALMGALLLGLRETMPLWAALVIVAALNGVIATVAFKRGLARPEPNKPDKAQVPDSHMVAT